MKKLLGIFGLLVSICVFTAVLEPSFLKAVNIQNTIRWTALFSILSIGATLVIIFGGIDLSIGSTVGLIGTLLPFFLTVRHWSPAVALPTVLTLSLLVGLANGLLITKMRLQPFVVTLCGLLFYRGISRFITADASQGFDNKFPSLMWIATGNVPLAGGFAMPFPFFIVVVLGALAAIFLNRTIYGRYLLALGRNETAARYSGINADAVKIVAYVACSGLAGLAGILFALNQGSVQPASMGDSYELYAIAGAVLGGCSLRGGEGSILGVIMGSAVMQLLYNSINMLRDKLEIRTNLEYAIIGAVILCGVIVDELVKRFAAKRRAGRNAAPK